MLRAIRAKGDALEIKMITGGYSMQKLAKEIGVTRQSISKILKGGHISSELAKKVCDYFDAEFYDFFMIVD